jgi:hypothetical protein
MPSSAPRLMVADEIHAGEHGPGEINVAEIEAAKLPHVRLRLVTSGTISGDETWD